MFKVKSYKFILIILLFLSLIFLLQIINTDVCLDSGLCAENLKVNTEYGLIKINKENCLKYNWKWNEKKKYCNMN